jgi:copper(I)-binding protein
MQVMAHTLDFGDIVIIHPAISESSKDAKTTCAYMKIMNRSDRAQFLLGATTAVAERTTLVEFRGSKQDYNEIARIEIPAGQTVDFKQSGWCLRLVGLTQSLYADAGVVQVQLFFANRPLISADFLIDSVK